VGAFVQVKQTKYPNSTYGVQSNDQNSLSVDVNYQASVTQTFTGYVSYQQADRKLNGNTGVGGVASCTVAQATYGLASGDWSACSDSSRPASANWSNDTKDTNSVIGATFQNDFGTARLIVDYSFSTSKTSTTNTYGSTALNATASGTATSQATQAAIIAANAMPDMTFKQHDLNLSLLVPVSKKTTVRISDSYTVGHVTDWHYDGVIHNAAAAFDSGTILQDGGAQNFHANMVGVFLNYKL
jgi:hypothetical protein